MSENETIPATNEDVAEDKKSVRLTDAQWAEIKEFYELGQKSISELAADYGITRQALSQRFKQHGITGGSRAHEVAAAIASGVATGAQTAAASVGAQGVEKYNDHRTAWIEETRVTGYKALKDAARLARSIVADHIKKASAAGATPIMSAIDDDLKAVHRFQKILAENTITRLNVLRSDDIVDEESLPTITFDDLTDDDIIKHHKEMNVIPEDADPAEVLAELNIYEGLVDE